MQQKRVLRELYLYISIILYFIRFFIYSLESPSKILTLLIKMVKFSDNPLI